MMKAAAVKSNKPNESRAAAHSISQQKSGPKGALGIADNRSGPAANRRTSVPKGPPGSSKFIRLYAPSQVSNLNLEKKTHEMGQESLQLNSKSPPPPVENKSNSIQTSAQVVQRRWIIEKKKYYYKWECLVDGVRWYADPKTGEMFYVIEDIKAIKIGKIKDYKAMSGEDHKQSRDLWLKMSTIKEDILSDLDTKAVKKGELTKGIPTTKKLKPYKIQSQFKDLFVLPGNRLLAVFKDNDSAKAINEVACLSRIAEAGLPTPNAKLIDVVHKKVKTLGVVMDKIEGVFVDIAKTQGKGLIGKILYMIAAGKEPPTSEFGLIKLMRNKMKGLIPKKTILETLHEELQAILKATQKLVINDLQMIISKEGKIVIIDPQWAGKWADTIPTERKFIDDTYIRLKNAIKVLVLGVEKKPEKKKSKTMEKKPGARRKSRGKIKTWGRCV